MDETSPAADVRSNVEDLGASMRRFGWADYLVFVVMLLMCSWIGVYWGFVKKQSNQEYLMGGRNMRILPVSLSLVASFISGISLLGTPTEIYVYGVQYMYIVVGVVSMAFILAYVYLPVYHELKLTSSYEYLERRFDKKMRVFGSVLFTISLITWLPIVIYVPALAFNQVTGINVHVITPIVCIVCIFYTCVGGLQAVVWTDVIQTVVMFGAVVLVAVKGTADIGGVGVVWQRNWESGRIEAPNWDINPLTRHTIWTLAVGGCFHWLVANAVSQSMVQRYLALSSIKAARSAVAYFVVGVLSLLGVCCYCGMLIYATYHLCDPLSTELARAKDQLLPLFVMDVLGAFPGLPGLFVAGVFSAALSSLSTGLNSMAAVVLEDFYKLCTTKPLTERQTSWLMKSVVVALGTICVGLVFVVERLGTVLQLSMSLSAVTNGASLGIFSMGLLLPRVHSRGALIGGISGLVTMWWICINAQAAISKGDIRFPEKPVSTEGCQYTFPSRQGAEDLPLQDVQHTDEVMMIYRLSYLWYTLMGTLITMGVALLVSLLWQPVDITKVNTAVMAPFLRKYYASNNASGEADKSRKNTIEIEIAAPSKGKL